MQVDWPEDSKKLEAFPVQLIPIPGGLVLKRGCSEVKIGGEGSGKAVRVLLAATSTQGASKAELLELFSAEDQPKVGHLIEELLRKQILAPSGTKPQVQKKETNQEIFYWHFDTNLEKIHQRLTKVHLAILGVNSISQRLSVALQAAGITEFDVIDHPKLRNLHLFEDSGILKPGSWPTFLKPPKDFHGMLDPEIIDCVVATCDFGLSPVVNEFNTWCIEHNRNFLPVILHNVIGYIGPFVVPGETACFDCLQARQNSHIQDCQNRDALKGVSFEGQHIVGFLPSMTGTLAEFAAMNVVKFYNDLWQPQVSTLIEINLLVPRLTSRKVLRIPRCPTCSLLKTRPSITLNKTLLKIPEKDTRPLQGIPK